MRACCPAEAVANDLSEPFCCDLKRIIAYTDTMVICDKCFHGEVYIPGCRAKSWDHNKVAK